MHSNQLKVINSTARFRVIVAGRRWGKSEAAARFALLGARRDQDRGVRGGVTWVILPTYDMARPFWGKMISTAPEGWITNTIGTQHAPNTIYLDDQRIEFKSGDHPERLVGEGLRRVILDECGALKNALWEESILPTLMDHSGDALLTGTPKLSQGHFFYKLYSRGLDDLDDEVQTFGGPTSENPWIKVSEFERMRREMPKRKFEQEVLGRFQMGDGMVFRDVEECVGPFAPGPTVSIGIDLARRADFTVLTGMNKKGQVTFLDRWRHVPWPVQEERIVAAAKREGRRPKCIIDSTGVGDPVVQHLEKKGLRVTPYLFTNKSKEKLVDGLVVAFESSEITIPQDDDLIRELQQFAYVTSPSGNTIYNAPEGAHDDMVYSLGMALSGIHRAGDTGITIGDPDSMKNEVAEQAKRDAGKSPQISGVEAVTSYDDDPDQWT
jgi:hypothetical protein